ncbi:DNA-binding protein HEXBP-like [Senna tora]|uniref:DNA-binding protein HEXBP-like n=1 Tax=Senna tora TaxID=362788 RepID=A0A834SPY2_9FABA|nr:DNA-binding protein HEXBP-like [Senna tora]
MLSSSASSSHPSMISLEVDEYYRVFRFSGHEVEGFGYYVHGPGMGRVLSLDVNFVTLVGVLPGLDPRSYDCILCMQSFLAGGVVYRCVPPANSSAFVPLSCPLAVGTFGIQIYGLFVPPEKNKQKANFSNKRPMNLSKDRNSKGKKPMLGKAAQDSCSKCGKNHGDKPCWFGQNVCFNCGKPGHYARDCRQPKKTSEGAKPPTKGTTVVSRTEPSSSIVLSSSNVVVVHNIVAVSSTTLWPWNPKTLYISSLGAF